MPSAAEKLLDQVLAHEVDLSRVSASMQQKILRQLKQLEQSLVAALVDVDPTAVNALSYRQKRQLALLAQSREIIGDAYRAIAGEHGGDLYDLARLETTFTKGAIESSIGIPLNTTALTQAQLSEVTKNTLIQGARSKEWWAGQSRGLQNRFARQMRMGILQGEGVAELTRRIRGTRAGGFRDGIMATSRREAAALARTSVQAVTNAAREATYQENADVVKGLTWITTLDGRQTDICLVRGGRPYTLNKKPIGHDVPWLEGPGRIHWQCRSTSTAILKSWEELSGPNAVGTPRGGKTDIDNAFENRLRERGFSAQKIALAKRNARASMDGQVPRDISMEDWLKGKGETFQNRLLGTGRAQLWRDGRIQLKHLVDDQARSVPLRTLLERHGIKPTPPKPKPKKKPKPPPTGRAAPAAASLEKQLGIPAYPAEGFTTVKEAEAYANRNLVAQLGTGKNTYPAWMADHVVYRGNYTKYFGKTNYNGLTIDAANEINRSIMKAHVQSDALGIPRIRGIRTNKRLTRRAASMGDGVLELNPDAINKYVDTKRKFSSLDEFVDRESRRIDYVKDQLKNELAVWESRATSGSMKTYAGKRIAELKKEINQLTDDAAVFASGDRVAIQKIMDRQKVPTATWTQPEYQVPGERVKFPFLTDEYLTADLRFDQLFWHEYGHQIHQHLDAEYTMIPRGTWKNRNWADYSRPWEGSRNYQPRIRPMSDDLNVRKNSLSPSEYSTKNANEWFAESFTLWIHAGDNHPALPFNFVGLLKDMGIYDKLVRAGGF